MFTLACTTLWSGVHSFVAKLPKPLPAELSNELISQFFNQTMDPLSFGRLMTANYSANAKGMHYLASVGQKSVSRLVLYVSRVGKAIHSKLREAQSMVQDQFV